MSAGVGLGERELDALVLPNRAAKHLALLRVTGCTIKEKPRITNAFGGDQDPLRIHAGEDVAEALPLLPDAVGGGDADIIEEHRRRAMIHHGFNRLDRKSGAVAHVEQEHRQAFGALGHLVLGRGAGQQHHQIALRRPACPDFLTINQIVVAVTYCCRAQGQRVTARCRFGHAKGLQAQLAPRNGWQILGFLRRRTMAQQRAHHIHLRMRRRTIAAAGVDLLQYRAGRRLRQARAAKLFRNQRRKPALARQRLHKFNGIVAVLVFRPPIFAGEASAEFRHCGADIRPIVHAAIRPSPRRVCKPS